MRALARNLVLALTVVMLAATLARAQVQTGSITGSVTDSSNAVLPGVTVTLSGEEPVRNFVCGA